MLNSSFELSYSYSKVTNTSSSYLSFGDFENQPQHVLDKIHAVYHLPKNYHKSMLFLLLKEKQEEEEAFFKQSEGG